MTKEEELSEIKHALVAARSGGASVPMLANAHELSEKHNLPHVTAELRTHIRHVIPDPKNGKVAIAKSIGLGIIAGIITNVIINMSTHRTRKHPAIN